jgi:hypothetical protein
MNGSYESLEIWRKYVKETGHFDDIGIDGRIIC